MGRSTESCSDFVHWSGGRGTGRSRRIIRSGGRMGSDRLGRRKIRGRIRQSGAKGQGVHGSTSNRILIFPKPGQRAILPPTGGQESQAAGTLHARSRMEGGCGDPGDWAGPTATLGASSRCFGPSPPKREGREESVSSRPSGGGSTMGAITKAQPTRTAGRASQARGQAGDHYARDGLRQLYGLLANPRQGQGCRLKKFEEHDRVEDH